MSELILTARIESIDGGHARIGVFQNGGKSGVLVVDADKAQEAVDTITTSAGLRHVVNALMDYTNNLDGLPGIIKIGRILMSYSTAHGLPLNDVFEQAGIALEWGKTTRLNLATEDVTEQADVFTRSEMIKCADCGERFPAKLKRCRCEYQSDQEYFDGPD